MDRPSWVGALQPTEPQGSALLARERQGSTLNTDEVANYIYTEQGLQRQGSLLRILENDAVFDKTQNYFEDRVERYKRSLRRAKRLAQLNKAHHWDEEDLLAAIELVGEPTSFTLHWTMFIVSREASHWLKKVLRGLSDVKHMFLGVSRPSASKEH